MRTLDNNIHEPSWHHNRLSHFLVPDETLDVLIGQRHVGDGFFGGVSSDGNATAELAVDLHDDLDRLLLERGLVKLGPALVNRRGLVTQRGPKGMADVRHHR